MSDNAKLLKLFAEAKKRRLAAAPALTLTHPGGLTLARAEQLARGALTMTDTERRHLDACPACARLLEQFRSVIGHPLPEGDAPEPNGVPHGPVLLKFSKPRPLPVSKGVKVPVAAAPPQDYAPASAPGSVFEADLYTYDGGVVLEIFTRQPALTRARLHFSLRDGDGREVLSGEMALEPNEAGLPAAARTLSTEEVDRLNGACSGVAVGVIEGSV